MKYGWECRSNDTYDFESTETFEDRREAYRDMLNEVYERISWEIDFDNLPVHTKDELKFNIHCLQDKINVSMKDVKYTFTIKEINE